MFYLILLCIWNIYKYSLEILYATFVIKSYAKNEACVRMQIFICMFKVAILKDYYSSCITKLYNFI